MGHVFVDVRIFNPNDPSLYVDIPNALIDTGATWTTIPSGFAPYLQLIDEGPFLVRTASGPQELRQSGARVQVQGISVLTGILLSDTDGRAVIGVTTLEMAGFAVDPVNQRLIPSEALLM